MVELYKEKIVGYIYGTPQVPKAPMTKEEFSRLLDSALWTKEDK